MRRARAATAAALTMVALLVPVSSARAIPSVPPPAQSAGHCMNHLPTHKKVVALTFDAGGGAGALHRILATLASQAVPATFFITGRWARAFPHRLQRIASQGHAIGNHSNTHPNMTTLSSDGFRQQVVKAEKAIDTTTPVGPWFRFPYGLHTPADVAQVNRLGYACIQWTVDTGGWLGTSGKWSAAAVVSRVLDGARPGEIVLMHVGANPNDDSTLDADALPTVISRLRDEGYSFVTLSSLLPGVG